MGRCQSCGNYCKDEYELCYSCYQEERSDFYINHDVFVEDLRQNSRSYRLDHPSPLEMIVLTSLRNHKFMEVHGSFSDSDPNFCFKREEEIEYENQCYYYDFVLFLQKPYNPTYQTRFWDVNSFPRLIFIECDGHTYHQTPHQQAKDRIKNTIYNLYKCPLSIKQRIFLRFPSKQIYNNRFWKTLVSVMQ